MNCQSLEKYQVLIYLAATSGGLLVGTQFPAQTGTLKFLLWPTLGLLLYITFIQVPLVRLGTAMRDTRFLAAAVVGNFLLVPILVWALVGLLPPDPAIRLGAFLVLLVPCTDWFITFTHLGGGDTKQAIAFSPISLLLQFFLLPVYLWLFLGGNIAIVAVQKEMLFGFVSLILVPLLLAYLTQRWTHCSHAGWGTTAVDRLAWLPVPLLALVVFMVAASQATLVINSVALLGRLAVIFVGFLSAAVLLARGLAALLHLSVPQGRVLAFSLGSRNSFVVLPLALALPEAFAGAVVVIVFQSLVELFGMLAYLWWVPRTLFPEQPASAAQGKQPIR